ncbi:MAG: transcriptional regulator HexR [Spongiibacteraceae bacterium]|nr:transcriptional regulator HexR [Spongiibacteraceae bacterium]
MAILAHLEKTLTSLSKAERRVAEVILQDPDAIVHITTGELARQADVSDPMVSRLCRSLGCKSFPDFKVQLAKSLARSISFLTEAVSPGDSTSSYIEKRINANQLALEYIRQHLDPTAIEQAVEVLANSKRIEIFAMGGCASIGQDAQHKLFRMGIATIAYQDNLMQRMAAAAADQNTAVLLISFTGCTQSLIEAAQIAHNSNAKLIAITTPESPLANVADITINSGAELEDTTVYVPMTTRIVILTIIDILATGLALTLGPDVDNKLQKIKHSLDNTKVDP